MYKILISILAMILISGCSTYRGWKDFPSGLSFDKLDKLYEKNFKNVKKDDDGWFRDTVQKVDFGGRQSKGKLSFETKDMKPGPGTGENGTTGSGNKPERFVLRLKAKGYSKAFDLYTMHKGRNGLRVRVKSENKEISVHIGGFITHGDRPDPCLWEVWWEDNKLWITADNQLCNGDDDLPWTVGNTNISFEPEAAYLGGGGARPFEGSLRNAKFVVE